MTDDLERVMPCLVPGGLAFSPAWDGPRGVTRHPDIGVVWGLVDRGGGDLRYVSTKTRRAWEQQGIDWQARALDNLVRATPRTWSHEFTDGSGALYAVGLLFADGLGPSRLLFTDDLVGALGLGYQVAVPERSMALAFRGELSPAQATTVQELIRESHRDGTRPWLREPFPGDWIVAEVV